MATTHSVPLAEAELPKSGWLPELWRFRELLYFLAWRDIKVRYTQAALGAAWALMQPLFTMLIFTFFFGQLAKMPSDGIPYPLFSYCGLVPWIYFSGMLGQVGNSLVTNSTLITKVYFPRFILPSATALSGLLDFSIGSLFMVAMMIYYRSPIGWTLLLWPLAVVAMVMVTLGSGMLLAALNVRYRDIKHVIPFVVQLGLFVTPVIYPANFLPAKLRPWLVLNPMSGIIEGFRACIFPQHSVDVHLLIGSLVVTVLIFVAGLVYFRKAEKTFADII